MRRLYLTIIGTLVAVTAFAVNDFKLVDLESAKAKDVEINYWWENVGNVKQSIAEVRTKPDTENLNWISNWRIEGTHGGKAIVDVAFQDDKVYISTAAFDITGALVGEISDGKITFKKNQHLGNSQNLGIGQSCAVKNAYLKGCEAYWEFDCDLEGYLWNYRPDGEDMVFTWNADKKEMRLDGENKGFMITDSYGYNENTHVYVQFIEPVITYQSDEDLCAAPLTPTYKYSQDNTWNIEFNNKAENGALLSYDDMSFEVFVNNELYVFTPADYNMPEDMTEIPCNFGNHVSWHGFVKCYGSSANVKIATYDDIDTFGVRTINNAPDGKKYYSPIVDKAALKTAEVENGVKATRYFDLQGRTVENPKPGHMLIKVETLSDGTARVTKMVR